VSDVALMRRLGDARIRAYMRAPYLAMAISRLRWAAAPGLGTVAVDATWRLYADPQAVDTWSLDELAGAVIHEVGHLLRAHHDRRRTVDAAIWNAAADLEINDDLLEAGIPLPSGALEPELLGFPGGLLAEEYVELLGPFGVADGIHDCGSGAHGESRPWDLSDDGRGPGVGDAEILRRHVAVAVSAAGDAPAGIRRWANGVLEPTIPWSRVLASHMGRLAARAAGGVTDWRRDRPSRRQAPGGVLLPRPCARQPHIAVVIDTSGSMGDRELAAGLAEVAGAVRAVGTPITVIACDTSATVMRAVTRARDVRLIGGGGTDMSNGLRSAADLRHLPDVVVVVTDGHTPWPAAPPTPLARTQILVALVGDGLPGPAWATTVRCVTTRTHSV
jgi:predicted metal-dependent peptidase